jgi:threonine dehydratase
VIAGQGTIGLELAEQVPQAGTVVIPVGGGGLASGNRARAAVGSAGRAHRRRPGGPHRADDRGRDRGQAGRRQDERDPREVLDDLISVGDDEICRAIVLLLERTKLVVEGAGAVGVAALLTGQAGGEGTAVAILSGGNIDPTVLISVMRHGLTDGRPLPRRPQPVG